MSSIFGGQREWSDFGRQKGSDFLLKFHGLLRGLAVFVALSTRRYHLGQPMSYQWYILCEVP
jgi:hypothetical protein